MKKILGIALLALFATFGCGKKAADEVPRVEKAGDAAGKAVLNAALQVSEMDVSALAEITQVGVRSCKTTFHVALQDLPAAVPSPQHSHPFPYPA